MRTPTEMNEHLLPLGAVVLFPGERSGWVRTPREMKNHLLLLKALLVGDGEVCAVLPGNGSSR